MDRLPPVSLVPAQSLIITVWDLGLRLNLVCLLCKAQGPYLLLFLVCIFCIVSFVKNLQTCKNSDRRCKEIFPHTRQWGIVPNSAQTQPSLNPYNFIILYNINTLYDSQDLDLGKISFFIARTCFYEAFTLLICELVIRTHTTIWSSSRTTTAKQILSPIVLRVLDECFYCITSSVWQPYSAPSRPLGKHPG